MKPYTILQGFGEYVLQTLKHYCVDFTTQNFPTPIPLPPHFSTITIVRTIGCKACLTNTKASPPPLPSDWLPNVSDSYCILPAKVTNCHRLLLIGLWTQALVTHYLLYVLLPLSFLSLNLTCCLSAGGHQGSPLLLWRWRLKWCRKRRAGCGKGGQLGRHQWPLFRAERRLFNGGRGRRQSNHRLAGQWPQRPSWWRRRPTELAAWYRGWGQRPRLRPSSNSWQHWLCCHNERLVLASCLSTAVLLCVNSFLGKLQWLAAIDGGKLLWLLWLRWPARTGWWWQLLFPSQ